VKSGDFDPTIILTNRFQLEEIIGLYEAFDKKLREIMKTFVQTKFSSPPAKGTPTLSTFRSGVLKPVPVAV
jgi:hypothetical protein